MAADTPKRKISIETSTLSDLVRHADEDGALARTLPELPPAVAGALQAIVAGERVSESLPVKDVALFGRIVAAWGAPSGRCLLSPWGPRFAASELIEHLGLSAETAERVASVIGWPIGFPPEDFVDWAALSSDEATQLMDYLVKAHGLYATGTKYAAP